MSKLSGVISLAAIVASSYAKVTVMDAAVYLQMKRKESTTVLDNNIGVSDSNVLLTQNGRFHVKNPSGTIHIRGASENDEDKDQEYFWRG
uniref:AlNc14C510G11982 protein n=1 Tax=Albugo laibachii Nc14 TaxID=890382 RepID=F0X0N6_9STRA|nr:AlNc14C510G11982 [Albugo laibachii Nc14]|eukprot:CCA27329.1 AlNc14C510G11982 [Albugo laibachii Nc14]